MSYVFELLNWYIFGLIERDFINRKIESTQWGETLIGEMKILGIDFSTLYIRLSAKDLRSPFGGFGKFGFGNSEEIDYDNIPNFSQVWRIINVNIFKERCNVEHRIVELDELHIIEKRIDRFFNENFEKEYQSDLDTIKLYTL